MINNIKIDPEFENKIPPLTEMETKTTRRKYFK